MIVGVGPGLGAALVRRFHGEGFKVAALSRDVRRCERLLPTDGGDRLKAFQADAGSWADLTDGVRQATEWFGEAPEVAIYNAAAMESDKASELDTTFMDCLKVTVAGGVALATAVIPSMRKAGKGSILFTGGGLSLEPHPNWTRLGMGKAALKNYAGALHKELLPANILSSTITICGLIEPGTDFDANRIADVYWQMHIAPVAEWKDEVVYMPGGNRHYNN